MRSHAISGAGWRLGRWRGVLAVLALCVMLLAACDSAQSNPGTDLGSGSLLAFIGQDGNFWMARADGSGAHSVTTTTCAATSNCYGPPAWSPDGQQLAVFGPNHTGQGNVIYIFNRLGLIQTTLIPADPLSFGQLRWTPDGQSVAYQGRSHIPTGAETQLVPDSLVIVSVTTGKQLAALTLPPQDAACPDQPTGGSLGSLIDHAINGFKGFRYTFDVSHDGAHFLVSSGVCALSSAIVNRDGSTPQALAPLSANAVISQASFSRDGQHIIATQHLADEDDLVLFNGDGSNGHVIYVDKGASPTFAPRLSTPTISIDDAMVYFTQGVDLWAINADGTQAHQLAAGAATGDPLKAEDAPLPSPDGKSLAWMELTYSATDNLPRTSLIVGHADGSASKAVAAGIVWPDWS